MITSHVPVGKVSLPALVTCEVEHLQFRVTKARSVRILNLIDEGTHEGSAILPRLRWTSHEVIEAVSRYDLAWCSRRYMLGQRANS